MALLEQILPSRGGTYMSLTFKHNICMSQQHILRGVVAIGYVFASEVTEDALRETHLDAIASIAIPTLLLYADCV